MFDCVLEGMVGCAYEAHEVCPVLPQEAELEERDCADQWADQQFSIQQLKRKVAQLVQLTPPPGEAAAASARYSELVRENEQLKQSVAVHSAKVRGGPTQAVLYTVLCCRCWSCYKR